MKGNHITARILEGLAQARRGEFVSEKEMKLFFARCSEPTVDASRVNECAHRSAAVDEGKYDC